MQPQAGTQTGKGGRGRAAAGRNAVRTASGLWGFDSLPAYQKFRPTRNHSDPARRGDSMLEKSTHFWRTFCGAVGTAWGLLASWIAAQWLLIRGLLERTPLVAYVVVAAVGAALAVFGGEYAFALLLLGAGCTSWLCFRMARRE